MNGGKGQKKLVTLTEFYICNSDAHRNNEGNASKRKAHMPISKIRGIRCKRKDGRTER